MLATVVFCAASRPAIEGLGDLLFALAFSFWVGSPLIFLGRVKLFASFPKLAAVLYVLGCCTLTGLFITVFVKPTGSTAAVVLITGPLLLTLAYTFTGVVLKLRKGVGS